MDPRTCEPANLLPLLHLCDSLFPIGGFGYSDGLETAAHQGATSIDDLRAWLDVCLDETFARLEGPAVKRAWEAVVAEDGPVLASIDAELIALRPSSSARRSTRAMGLRLVTTWHAIYPSPRLEHVLHLVGHGALTPTLPVAFASACGTSGIGRHDAIQAYAYTRLAATISAAMRVMPIGQTDAHRLLAGALGRVPAIVRAIEQSTAPFECFCPLLDIAAMTQQYLESRLFRS
jgi:urease accessory protein